MLIILAVLSGMAIPAYLNAAREREASGVDVLSGVLTNGRRFAVLNSVNATVVIDPQSGHYRIDTSGAGGYGIAVDDSLRLSLSERLETDRVRLIYRFRPDGGAFGDTVLVRGTDSTRLVTLDQASGAVVVYVR